MNELQDYLQSMLAHLDDMAKRTIFMMGVQYGKEKSQAQQSSPLNTGQQFFQPKTAIEEIEEMLIELKINGSVRQRSNGLIEFRNPVFGSVYGRTPEELQEKLKQKIRYEKAHIAKPAKKKKSPLLSEFYENNYLPYKQTKNLAESTIRGIKYNFKFIREQEGFNKPLTEYSSKDIEEFLLSIPQTRKRQIIQGLLNNMFTRALADSLISANPCAPLEKMEHDTDEGKALSFEEQKIFFEKLFTDKTIKLEEKCYFTFVYLAGTRRDEARNLRICDIDFKKSIIHIRGTKTDGSDRYMPLFPLAEKVLRCANPEGKPFRIYCSRIYKIFNKILDKYKLHDLRHTFGTIQICVEKIETKTVSLWMGHTNTQTTLDRYTHPEQLDRSVFLRGDLTEDQKLEILRKNYADVLHKIEAFLDERTQIVPKI